MKNEPSVGKLQELVFPEGVLYDREKEAYRTTRINSIFALTRLVSQKEGQKKKGKSDADDRFSPLVARTGIEPVLPE